MGGTQADILRGTGGTDLICGLGGNDTIAGGRGSDRLFGEDGNDRILARDGRFDVVGCGRGRDAVVADRIDLVGRDCGVSRRRRTQALAPRIQAGAYLRVIARHAARRCRAYVASVPRTVPIPSKQ